MRKNSIQKWGPKWNKQTTTDMITAFGILALLGSVAKILLN